jgi:hypothetical protein
MGEESHNKDKVKSLKVKVKSKKFIFLLFEVSRLRSKRYSLLLSFRYPGMGEESHNKDKVKSLKAKVKSKKFISCSSKSPDFEVSTFPSCCYSDQSYGGRNLMAHNGNQEPGGQGQRTKDKG